MAPQRDEPEMNLVPMIDVLLVIVIFLVVTTTYSRYLRAADQPAIGASQPGAGEARIRSMSRSPPMAATWSSACPSARTDPATISVELKRAARGNRDPMIVINADGSATHQSVINVMEAARPGWVRSNHLHHATTGEVGRQRARPDSG